jgi:membrane peptidoglycan carboxypeptidase
MRAAVYGVKSDLPPVMSLPLGAAEISLEEAALLIQGIATGQRWSFPGVVELGDGSQEATEAPEHATLLIKEIRDRDGKTLWEARPRPRLVGDPTVGRMTGEVLRNVVRWGTGRRALSVARVDGQIVPLTGKTGTTNSFRNAAFCGFVPRSTGDGWSWADGYTVAAYVGFDDNTSMSRGGVRIAGSSGALPGWMHTAAGLAAGGLLGKPTKDQSAELRVEGGYSRVAVRADGSGVWEPVESASIEDADRYTVVWGAGVLADGTLDVSRRLTLLPGEDQEAAPGPLPQRVSTDDAVEDVGEMDDLGDEIDPFIAPEEAP